MATGLDRAERARRLLAPAVAALTVALGLCCLVTLPDVVAGWPALDALDGAVTAWAGLALAVAVAVAGLALLSAGRIGSAPPLAFGTVVSVLGLVLSRDVDTDAQVILGLLTLAAGAGSLLVVGICIVEELPERPAGATVASWVVVMAGGWGLLGWLAVRGRTAGVTRLGLHPPGWALAVTVAVIVAFVLLTLLLEPSRDWNPSGAGWENAWAGLCILVAAVACIVMLVGFQPRVTTSWVRPVVLLTTALALGGLLACGRLVPRQHLRPAYLGVVVTLLTGPGCLHLMIVVSHQSTGRAPWWEAVALAAAGLAGCRAGWIAPERGPTQGLLLMAVAAAGGWVMPSTPWLMLLVAAPFAAGLAACLAASLRLAASDRTGLRYVAGAAVVALMFGLLSAAPLMWSLGAAVTGRMPAARDGGRVLLGLTFALLVLSAAGIWVLQQRAADSGGAETLRRSGSAREDRQPGENLQQSVETQP